MGLWENKDRQNNNVTMKDHVWGFTIPISKSTPQPHNEHNMVLAEI